MESRGRPRLETKHGIFDDQFLPASAKGTRPDVGGRLAGAYRLCTMVCGRSPSISGMAAAPIRVQAWVGAVGGVRIASPMLESLPVLNFGARPCTARIFDYVVSFVQRESAAEGADYVTFFHRQIARSLSALRSRSLPV